MGVDEVIQIHERLERLLSYDWQILFSPLILLAGLGWLHVLLRIRRDAVAVSMWMGGAAAWVAAQLLESAAWGWWFGPDRQAANYLVMMISEELLEMIGSTLFLMAQIKLQETSRQQNALREFEVGMYM